MKLEKKHWIIIGVVVAIIAVWYFFLRKKKAESGYAGIYGNFGNESGYKMAGLGRKQECCCDAHCDSRSAGCCNNGGTAAKATAGTSVGVGTGVGYSRG